MYLKLFSDTLAVSSRRHQNNRVIYISLKSCGRLSCIACCSLDERPTSYRHGCQDGSNETGDSAFRRRDLGAILSHCEHALGGDWGIQSLLHPVFLLPGHELSSFASPQAPAKMRRLIPAPMQWGQLIVDWISRSVLTCPPYKLLS